MVDDAGSAVTGLRNGLVVRLDPGGTTILGDTGGRPLGIEACPDGSYLICDHDKGLVSLDPESGRISTVLSEIGGAPLRFCSNAVVGEDGSIYFTTSSETAAWDDYQADVIAHATSGRLIWLGPQGEVTVLARNLAFANGLEIAADGASLLVAETIAYRIRRFWLKGPNAGTWSDFIDGLPGFPDNISLSESGLLWVALPAPRLPLLDFLLPRAPALRSLVLSMPHALHPRPRRIIWVQAYDRDGRLIHNIRTRHPRLSFVTAAAERDGALWLASARRGVLGRIDLPGS